MPEITGQDLSFFYKDLGNLIPKIVINTNVDEQTGEFKFTVLYEHDQIVECKDRKHLVELIDYITTDNQIGRLAQLIDIRGYTLVKKSDLEKLV